MSNAKAQNKLKDVKKLAIEAAFDYVHPDVESLVKQAASEHTIANMGQMLEDFFYGAGDPKSLFHDCFSCFYQQSESDEMADGLMEERADWVKQAKKDAAKIVKKKLPLTMRNMRDAFEQKGAFAKKK